MTYQTEGQASWKLRRPTQTLRSAGKAVGVREQSEVRSLQYEKDLWAN